MYRQDAQTIKVNLRAVWLWCCYDYLDYFEIRHNATRNFEPRQWARTAVDPNRQYRLFCLARRALLVLPERREAK